AGVDLDELASAGAEEGAAGIGGRRPGQQRLAGARRAGQKNAPERPDAQAGRRLALDHEVQRFPQFPLGGILAADVVEGDAGAGPPPRRGGAKTRRRAPGVDRKSTRLNSSHVKISYAVFCLKKKKKQSITIQTPDI